MTGPELDPEGDRALTAAEAAYRAGRARQDVPSQAGPDAAVWHAAGVRDAGVYGPHDPGDPGRSTPGQHLDPKVNQLVHELRHQGITTQVGAIHAIADREGAGLNPGQIAVVLWQFAPPEDPAEAAPAEPPPLQQLRPVGPCYIPPEQREPQFDLDEAMLPERYWEDH